MRRKTINEDCVVELDDYKCIYDVHKNCFQLHWMATLPTAD